MKYFNLRTTHKKKFLPNKLRPKRHGSRRYCCTTIKRPFRPAQGSPGYDHGQRYLFSIKPKANHHETNASDVDKNKLCKKENRLPNMYPTGEPKEMLKIIQDTLTILRQESFLLLLFFSLPFFISVVFGSFVRLFCALPAVSHPWAELMTCDDLICVDPLPFLPCPPMALPFHTNGIDLRAQVVDIKDRKDWTVLESLPLPPLRNLQLHRALPRRGSIDLQPATSIEGRNGELRASINFPVRGVGTRLQSRTPRVTVKNLPSWGRYHGKRERERVQGSRHGAREAEKLWPDKVRPKVKGTDRFGIPTVSQSVINLERALPWVCVCVCVRRARLPLTLSFPPSISRMCQRYMLQFSLVTPDTRSVRLFLINYFLRSCRCLPPQKASEVVFDSRRVANQTNTVARVDSLLLRTDAHSRVSSLICNAPFGRGLQEVVYFKLF